MATNSLAMPAIPQVNRSPSGTAELVGCLVCLFLFLLSCGYAAWLHWQTPVPPDDDAYITYRYAANLLAGRGLTYNEGERVFGASTPVFVLWSALLTGLASWLSVEPPQLVVWGNALWLLLAGAALIGLLCRVSAGAGYALPCLAAALMVLATPVLWGSLLGMESSMFLALLLWGLAAGVKGSVGGRCLGGLLLGLGSLARAEGLAALVIYLAHLAWTARRRAVWPAVVGLAPPAIWLAFATLYFGGPVPQSVIAKSTGIYPFSPMDTLNHLKELMRDWWPLLGAGICVVAAGLAVVAGAVEKRSPPVLLALLGMWAVTVTGYVRAGLSVPHWYHAHLYGCLFVVLAVGTLAVVGAVRRFPLTAWRHFAITGAAAVALLMVALPAAGAHLRLAVWGHRWPEPAGWRWRVLAYREAAEWINRHAPSDVTVLSPEIGALGYWCRRRILDACGLISPQTVKYLPVAAEDRPGPEWGVIPPELVRDQSPDVIVTLPVFARDGLFERDWFQREYELVKTIPLPAPAWGDEALLVYVRRTVDPG